MTVNQVQVTLFQKSYKDSAKHHGTKQSEDELSHLQNVNRNEQLQCSNDTGGHKPKLVECCHDRLFSPDFSRSVIIIIYSLPMMLRYTNINLLKACCRLGTVVARVPTHIYNVDNPQASEALSPVRGGEKSSPRLLPST